MTVDGTGIKVDRNMGVHVLGLFTDIYYVHSVYSSSTVHRLSF